MLFYESEEIIQKSSKLIEVNCLQVMKSKQNYCLTCFTQTCQLCVPTIVEVSFMKNIFWCGFCAIFVDLCRQKSW